LSLSFSSNGHLSRQPNSITRPSQADQVQPTSTSYDTSSLLPPSQTRCSTKSTQSHRPTTELTFAAPEASTSTTNSSGPAYIFGSNCKLYTDTSISSCTLLFTDSAILR
ncbi:hypothetical protein PanWU01x14_150970, partial [Parasponia andersonii]